MVETDGAGNVVVEVQCALGENRIYIVDQVTQATLQILLCTKNLATLLATSAEEFDREDGWLNRLLRATSIIACHPSDLASVWGYTAGIPQLYDADTYRDILIEIYNARRLLAGKLEGLERAVGAITGVMPLDLFRIFAGPRWVLGLNFLANDHFQVRSFQASPSPLFPGVLSAEFTPNASPGIVQLTWADPVFSYTDPVYGLLSTVLNPGYSGPVNFFGGAIPAVASGVGGPFLIIAGNNDLLRISIDKLGVIDINLPLGLQTAAAVVAAINAALVADVRYGAPYAAVATNGGGRVVIRSLGVGSGAFIEFFDAGTVSDAAILLFQAPPPKAFQGLERRVLGLTIDRQALGAAGASLFALNKSPYPDNWILTAGIGADSDPPRRMTERSPIAPEFQITRTLLGTAEVYAIVDPEIDAYKGWDFKLGSWIRSNATTDLFYGVSFDDGLTWTESPAIAFAPWDDPTQGPQYTEWSFIYDPNATSLRIRLRFDGSPLGSAFVSQVVLKQDKITAAYLASKTVARSRHRSFFGHLLFAWCVDPLSTAESELISLTSPPWSNALIESMSPVQVQVDRFNVTEFDLPTGNSINLKGVLGEADWVSSTRTNLQVRPRIPSRLTFVEPSVSGVIVTTLLVNQIAPHNALLPFASDLDLEDSVLFENGIPLPQDKWTYLDENTLQIDPTAFIPGGVYELSYRAIYRAVSPVIDLGDAYADYVWYADYHIRTRLLADQVTTDEEIVLFIDFQTLTANLDRSILADQNTVQIFRSNGTSVLELPARAYSIVNPTTIQFDGSFIQGGAIYTMKYKELGVLNTPRSVLRFYVRTGANPVAVEAAPWIEIDRNRAVSTLGKRYGQLRLDVTKVDRQLDLQLTSLAFKGLHLFGIPSIPGVT